MEFGNEDADTDIFDGEMGDVGAENGEADGLELPEMDMAPCSRAVY